MSLLHGRQTRTGNLDTSLDTCVTCSIISIFSDAAEKLKCRFQTLKKRLSEVLPADDFSNWLLEKIPNIKLGPPTSSAKCCRAWSTPMELNCITCCTFNPVNERHLRFWITTKFAHMAEFRWSWTWLLLQRYFTKVNTFKATKFMGNKNTFNDVLMYGGNDDSPVYGPIPTQAAHLWSLWQNRSIQSCNYSCVFFGILPLSCSHFSY